MSGYASKTVEYESESVTSGSEFLPDQNSSTEASHSAASALSLEPTNKRKRLTKKKVFNGAMLNNQQKSYDFEYSRSADKIINHSSNDGQPRKQRLSWSIGSNQTILNYFPNALDKESKLPSAFEIRIFLKNTKDPILNQKTVPQVRAWMHNQRYKKHNQTAASPGNHIPNWMYTIFQNPHQKLT